MVTCKELKCAEQKQVLFYPECQFSWLLIEHWYHRCVCQIHIKKGSNQTASIACASGVIWTAWCKVILEKLTVSQLVKKYFTFYETGRFVTFLMRTYHLFLSWAICIVHVIQFCSCKIHFGINFQSIFRLTKSSLPVIFPHQDLV